jgi:hypothetical protein
MTKKRKIYSPVRKTDRRWSHWTEAELVHIRLLFPNVTLPNRTQEAIRKRAQQMGLVKPRPVPLVEPAGFSHRWVQQWTAHVPSARSVWDLAR